MPEPRRCIVVGDAMMDVTVRIDSAIAYASDTPAQISVQPGGSAANTAAWLAHLGHPTTFVGCVGADEFGRAIKAGLVAVGVEPRLAIVPDLPTGTCVVVVDSARERTMFPDPGANSRLTVGQAPPVGSGDHLHLSGYTLLNRHSRDAGLAVLSAARRAGATTSLDPASAGPLRECRDLVRAALADVDLLVANEAEAAVLAGLPDYPAEPDTARIAAADLARLVATVVVKRGPQGVFAVSGGSEVDVPALPASVVDTTGAGDAFSAGFLPGWLVGETLADAVSAGQRCAVEAIGRVGGSPMAR